MGSCGFPITGAIGGRGGEHLWVQEEHPAVSIPWVHWGGRASKDKGGRCKGSDVTALSPQLALLYQEVLYTIRHRLGKPQPQHVADSQELCAYVQKVGASPWDPQKAIPKDPTGLGMAPGRSEGSP